jgi:WD40 repeat protein
MLKKNLMFFLIVGLILSGCQGFPFQASPAAILVTAENTAEAPSADQPIQTEPAIAEPIATHQPSPTPIPDYEVIQMDRLEDLQVVATATVEAPVSILWSTDSSRLGILSTNGFSVFSGENAALLKSIVLAAPYSLMDASIEREIIAVTTDQLSIEFRSMDTGEVLSTLKPDEMFLSGTFRPDGFSFLLSSAYSITAEEWDVETNQMMSKVEGFETAAPVYNARYNDKGSSIIWTARGTVQVYDAKTGELGAVMGHEDFVNSSDLAPNGRMLAAATVGTIDGDFKPIVRIWDAFGGQILANLPTGESIASHVRFSPDGSLLVVSSGTTVSIWQVQTQANVWQAASQGGNMRDAKISPDGKTLAIIAENGTLQFMRILKK